MKILIFNWQDIRNPLAGGAEVHLHEIFSRIAGMGHRVTLFCSSFPGAAVEETIDGIRVMPTFHPAYLLRNPAAKREVWDDMKKVMAELKKVP